MAKRQIEHGANANYIPIGKKRKIEPETPAVSAVPNDTTVKPTKEQRREQKARLKAEKKAQQKVAIKASKSNGHVNGTTVSLSSHVEEPASEKDATDKAKAKSAKKAEKARLKALRKGETVGDEREHSPVKKPVMKDHTATTSVLNVSHNDVAQEKADMDKEAAEAAREAEKTSVTALKKARKMSKADSHVSASELGTLPPTGYLEDPALTALPQSEIDSFLSSNFIAINDPASTRTLRPITKFSYLPASTRSGSSPFATFKNPTPIQSAAWPFLLSGRDVIGVAETGSGKTLAFGVPCVRYISSLPPQSRKSSTARAVIISPTRELAVQIYEQIVQLAKPAGLQAVCVYGGVPKDAQRLALKSAHIVVATPGRLNDLINEGAANLSEVKYLVLDEADRMLDKGFEEEIRKIISTTPSTSSTSGSPGRQTLMFTATWPPSVRDLASTFMRSPVKISIGDNPTGELRANVRIEQRVEVVDPRAKETRLLQLIKQHQSGPSKNDRILVFCLYKKEATRVENFLRSKGLRVAGIHGDLSQEKRSASLEAFKKDGGVPLLVATDVAARGLDIPAVKLVINVTFPLTVEDYVHRIGR